MGLGIVGPWSVDKTMQMDKKSRDSRVRQRVARPKSLKRHVVDTRGACLAQVEWSEARREDAWKWAQAGRRDTHRAASGQHPGQRASQAHKRYAPARLKYLATAARSRPRRIQSLASRDPFSTFVFIFLQSFNLGLWTNAKTTPPASRPPTRMTVTLPSWLPPSTSTSIGTLGYR